MKTYNANAKGLFLGLYRYLHIIGVGRGTDGASDFTDADGSQTITLMTPGAGDLVNWPLAAAYTKIGFAGTGLTAVTLDVGFSGGEEFIKDAAMFALNASAGAVLASQSGGPKSFDGSTLLTAKVDTTGANLADITAGEIWIYTNCVPIGEALKSIDA